MGTGVVPAGASGGQSGCDQSDLGTGSHTCVLPPGEPVAAGLPSALLVIAPGPLWGGRRWGWVHRETDDAQQPIPHPQQAFAIHPA